MAYDGPTPEQARQQRLAAQRQERVERPAKLDAQDTAWREQGRREQGGSARGWGLILGSEEDRAAIEQREAELRADGKSPAEAKVQAHREAAADADRRWRAEDPENR